MIKVLGAKRIAIIAVLVAVNAVLAAGIYMYIQPEVTKKERELRSLKGKIKTVSSDITRMQIEFDQFEEQQAQFNEYKKDGFFIKQNRRQVRDLFEQVQKASGVNAASVSIAPAAIEGNDEAEKAKHKVLSSNITVDIDALSDIDIFNYIFLLQKYFPGHLAIETISYEREADINGTILRAIASGRNFPLVSAKIALKWRTMIPEDQVLSDER